MNEYETLKGKFASLTRCDTGFYRELSILNYMTINVVMVDDENNRLIIPPVHSVGAVQAPYLCIMERGGTTPSTDSVGHSVQMDGWCGKIRQSTIASHPVFVSEINVVFATEIQALSVKHPNAQVAYQEGLESAILNLGNTIQDAPCVRVIANDPTGSIERLYTCIGDKPSAIPVTHLRDTDVTITILYVRDGVITKDIRSLEKLTSGTTNMVEFGNCVIPWVTTSEVCAEQRAKNFSWVSPEALESIRSSMSQEHKRQLEQANAVSSAKITELQTKLSSANSELEQVKTERDDYKFKYNTLKADRQQAVDQSNIQYAAMKAQNDFALAQGNLQLNGYKLQQAKQETEWKTWQLCAAACLPVVGVIAMELFKSAMKK